VSEPDIARPSRTAGSFRDPAGFLFERDGVLYRQVSRSFADTYDAVVASGLYDALHREGLLVAHDEVDGDLAADPADAYVVLRPERIPFVSYPYEWCPGQLREAALLTLRIQDVALDHGMTLRDASAYNVQFVRGRPVFIDTLSFAPRLEGEPWVAYHQFCRHFLAPLALETKVDVRLASLLRADVAGVPLDLASTLLPASTRFRPGLLTHLHMQAKAQRSREAVADEPRKQVTFSDRAVRGIVDQLRGAVRRLTWDPGHTTWSDYYAEADHYSDDAMGDKLAQVAAFLDRVGPTSVWDLGANTGRFSQLAAERGADVVAFDIDPGAIEAAWRHLAGDGHAGIPGSVLPLVLDLNNPSPGIGWANTERDSLAARGPADAVLGLALVHHLAIGNNVPLPAVVEHLCRLGRDVLVEFVPKDDPKVQVLLATREDVFAGYTLDAFEAAAARHATVVDRHPLRGSGRVLYHLRSG
jgi:SAM-dependent methyltransferase